jgi:hypothetical protein
VQSIGSPDLVPIRQPRFPNRCAEEARMVGNPYLIALHQSSASERSLRFAKMILQARGLRISGIQIDV